MKYRCFLAVAGLSLTGLAQQGAAENVMETYGYNDEPRIIKLYMEFMNSVPVAYCGTVMTDEACAAVKDNVEHVLPKHVKYLGQSAAENASSRYGSEQEAIKVFHALPEQQQKTLLCDAPIDMRCEVLLDTFFSGSFPVVMEARALAAKQVSQFYKDGRAFTE